MALKIEEIEKQMRGNVDSCCHPEYWNIRNYAPDIAEQYIKARRFEVTDEFIAKVYAKERATLAAETNTIGDNKTRIKAVLETLWEEIEQ